MDDPRDTSPNPDAFTDADTAPPAKAPAGGGSEYGNSDRRPIPDNETTREVFESAEQQRKAVDAEREAKQ